ncbi:MAG: efflux RND transporter periplasmic adaptor subunit [Thermomonas haemolytica]
MSQLRRPRRSPLRKAGIAVVVIAALAVGWHFWHKRGQAAEGGYRTETVQRGDIRVAISSTGTLSAITTVTVGSQISGQVTKVLADYNSPVEKGQVLAVIDPSTYEAQIRQGEAQIASARAQLAQAQATLRNATLDYQRKSDLGRQQLVAQSDVDQARAAMEQAQAQVNSAQAAIRQQTASTQTTRVNLERTVIRSPVDGVVLTRKIEPGQTVAASLQAPELFTIAEDLSKMKIELAVDESDIGQVKVGQAVSFTADAFPDRRFRGTVEQVRLAATTNNNVVTYPVVVTVDNSDGTLLPGLTVNAEIEVSKRTGVLKLANAALRFKPSDGSPLAALQPQSPQQGGNRLFGGGGMRMGGGAGGPDASMQAQIRARMRERLNQQFAAFRASLDEGQRARWDAAVDAQLNAKRVSVYRLAKGGKPELVNIRLGASDGSATEVMGDIREGDQIISGERAVGAP